MPKPTQTTTIVDALEAWTEGLTEPMPDRPRLPVGTQVRYTGHADPNAWLCGEAMAEARARIQGRVGVIRTHHGVMPHMAAGRFEHPASHLYEVAFGLTQPLATLICCDRELEPVD